MTANFTRTVNLDLVVALDLSGFFKALKLFSFAFRDSLKFIMSYAINGKDDIQMTSHDKEILNQIFNPGLPYGDEVDSDSGDNIPQAGKSKDYRFNN